MIFKLKSKTGNLRIGPKEIVFSSLNILNNFDPKNPSLQDYENSLSSRLLFSGGKLENAAESASNLALLLLFRRRKYSNGWKSF